MKNPKFRLQLHHPFLQHRMHLVRSQFLHGFDDEGTVVHVHVGDAQIVVGHHQVIVEDDIQVQSSRAPMR